MTPDTFGAADLPHFAYQAPTKRFKLTRRHAFAAFGAGALAVGLPAALAAEHRGKEQPLVDLQAVLVALQRALLGRDLLRRRKEPRHDARRSHDQILDPHEARASHGERVIDGIDVAMEETHARLARALGDEVRRGVLALAAPRLRR